MILFESLTSLLLTFLIMTVVCLVVEAILCISLYSYHWFLGDFSFMDEDDDHEFVRQKINDKKRPIFLLEERTFSSCNRSYQTECPICLEEFQPNNVITKTECRHVFHKECIKAWLQNSKSTCPCCRQQLLHTSYTKKESLGIYSINDDVSISSMTTPLTMDEARPSTYSSIEDAMEFCRYIWTHS